MEPTGAQPSDPSPNVYGEYPAAPSPSMGQPTAAYPPVEYPSAAYPSMGYPAAAQPPMHPAAVQQPPMGYTPYPPAGHPAPVYPGAPNGEAYAQAAAAAVPEHLAPDYSADFLTALRRTLSRPLRFRGLASRREFWFSYIAWVGFVLLMFVPLVLLAMFAGDSLDNSPVLGTVLGVLWLAMLAFSMVFLLPAMVRRLHDTGRSGWWLLLELVPYGGLAVLVLLALEPRPWLWRPQWIGQTALVAPDVTWQQA